jgi:hypothetical protein
MWSGSVADPKSPNKWQVRNQKKPGKIDQLNRKLIWLWRKRKTLFKGQIS